MTQLIIFSFRRTDQVPETYEILIYYVMNERSQWNEMEPKWSQRRRIFWYNIVLYNK